MLNFLAILFLVPVLLGAHQDHPGIHHPSRQRDASREDELLKRENQISAIKKELEKPATHTPENLKQRAELRSKLTILTKRF